MTEPKECPKCEATLPPVFSTGRLVCTKCGWSNRPARPPHSTNPIVETTLDNVKQVLDKVFPRDSESVEKKVAVKEAKTRNSSNWAGDFLFVIGLLTMMAGLFYDTTVRSSDLYSDARIVNTGKVSDRATITNVGGFFLVCGAILSSKPSGKKED